MRLSAPIFTLKRQAKLLARDKSIPLHDALDQVAQREGFAQWSLLASRASPSATPQAMLSELRGGDLLLLAARPGQGKTMLGLQLLHAAACDDRRAVLFSLEMTEKQATGHLSLMKGRHHSVRRPEVVCSDDISADVVINRLAGCAPGTVALVDYLQVLDQQRAKPALADQVVALSEFAKQTGVVLGFISQVDRSFELKAKRLPDLTDVRLPNPVDLRLFSKTCFIHGGEAEFRAAA